MNTATLPVCIRVRFGLMVLLTMGGLEVRAAPAVCEVVAVSDGATLTVACAGAAPATVRLAGIEGPAHQALFRARAERSLAGLLLHKQVTVRVVGTAADGAQLAQVHLGSLHVNARVVGSGMAVCQARGAGDWCVREEAQARSGLRGLWSDPWLSTRAPERAEPVKGGQAT